MDLKTIQIQMLLEKAMRFAERGEYREAAEAYERVAAEARSPTYQPTSLDVPKLLRSVYFNLAQVLNNLREFRKALSFVEEGLGLSPTEVGRAIGLSAKGEALCGLGRVDEGMTAFREAVQAHPIIGGLNSADSMARLGSNDFLVLAEQWVEDVLVSFGNQLDPPRRSEVCTIRGKIAAKRSDYAKARAQFERALEVDPQCAEAKLHLSRLPLAPRKGG